MIYVEKLLTGYRRLDQAPTYWARGVAYDAFTHKPHMASAVIVGHGTHGIKHGRSQSIRRVHDKYLEEFAELDRRRAEIKKLLAEVANEERGLIQLAFATGRPVTVAEAKAESARRQAEHEAKKAEVAR
jgi:hypothetical protein